MSCSHAKGGWEVRWRDATGRQRSRRFPSEDAAKQFDEAIHDHELGERKQSRYGRSGGIYPYETASGTRWRCAVRRSDGSFTSKRGFTSEKAARDARRRLTEKQERGEVRDMDEPSTGSMAGAAFQLLPRQCSSRAKNRQGERRAEDGKTFSPGRSSSGITKPHFSSVKAP